MIDLFTAAYAYAMSHLPELQEALGQHLLLVAVALGIGILLCVPLGIWTSRSRLAALTVINTFNALRVIPSLAILFLAIPYFGLSTTSAVIALTLLPSAMSCVGVAFRARVAAAPVKIVRSL